MTGSSPAAQTAQLARRSLTRTLRQPAPLAMAIVFPLVLWAINSSGLAAASSLADFPTTSYMSFLLAVPFIQGALFSIINTGTDLARDIETGFLNRLALTPLHGYALIAGLLGGAVLMGLIQAATYTTVGMIAGAELAAGAGGIAVIVALSVLIALGAGSLGLLVALRTGSGEAVQGMFPVFFVFLFISSMALPRNLIEAGWFREIATLNPVSYLIEAIRSLLITGWDGEALALGFGVAAAIAVAGITAASLALRTRLVRT